MRPTIKDVARECGVDISTVSRSLSGRPGVHEATRSRVIDAAKRLNYRPNRIAQTMATGSSQTIALVVSDIRNPFFAEIARGAEDAAYEAGLDLVLCNCDLSSSKQLHYLRSLSEKRVHGLVMNSIAPLTAVERQELAGLGTPVVLLNRVSGSRGFSSVSSDNEGGGRIAAKHLLALGHKRLAHITGPNVQGNLNDRAHGFVRAVEAAGLQAPLVMRGCHTMEGGYALTRKLLSSKTRVTGIFAGNDAMAFGSLRAMIEAGIRVPEDVSLIGFDNIEMSAVTMPPLTTIHQPKYEMGKAAVEILLNTSAKITVPENRILGVTLVERKSCRRVN
jgi:LacI family transcriptional regulator